MPYYDFKCVNEDCKAHGKRVELEYKMSEVSGAKPVCEACGAPMKRKIYPVKHTWSSYKGQLLNPDMNPQDAEDALYNAIEESEDK